MKHTELFENSKKKLNSLLESIHAKYDFDFGALEDLGNLPQLIEHHQTCKNNIIKNSAFNSYHTDEHFVKHCAILEALSLIQEDEESYANDNKPWNKFLPKVRSSSEMGNIHSLAQRLYDIGRTLNSGVETANFYKMAQKEFGDKVVHELRFMIQPDGETEKEELDSVAHDIETGIDRNNHSISFIINNLDKIENLVRQVKEMDENTEHMISHGTGIDSGKKVRIVDRSNIKTDGRGIPTNVIGAYKPVDWSKEVAVQHADGSYGLMFKNRLKKVNEDHIKRDYTENESRKVREMLRKLRNVKDMNKRMNYAKILVNKFEDEMPGFDTEWFMNAAQTKDRVFGVDFGFDLKPLKDKTIEKTNEGTKMNKFVKTIMENMELEKAEVVLAVKSISDDLQTMIEKASKMQVEDLLPIIERIKAEWGIDFAQSIEMNITSALATSVEALKQTKDSIDNEALKLSGEVPMNHMEQEPEMGAEDDDFGAEDSVQGPKEEPLGRAKKESIGESIGDEKSIYKVTIMHDYFPGKRMGRATVTASSANGAKAAAMKAAIKQYGEDAKNFKYDAEEVVGENASAGATSAGGVASIPMAVGDFGPKKVIRRKTEETVVDEAEIPYGDKRDYPKIDLYAKSGKYLGSTNWAKNTKVAVEQYAKSKNVDPSSIHAIKADDKRTKSTIKDESVPEPHKAGDTGKHAVYNPTPFNVHKVEEKWDTKMKTPASKKGMFDGWTVAELEKERAKLKAKKEHTAAESTKLREINFALRAKHGFGKVSEAENAGTATGSLKNKAATKGQYSKPIKKISESEVPEEIANVVEPHKPTDSEKSAPVKTGGSLEKNPPKPFSVKDKPKEVGATGPAEPVVVKHTTGKKGDQEDQYLFGEVEQEIDINIDVEMDDYIHDINSALSLVTPPDNKSEKMKHESIEIVEAKIKELECMIGNGTVVDPKSPQAKQLSKLYMRREEINSKKKVKN